MSESADTSPTTRFEGEPQAYNPQKDVNMHRVTVRDEFEPDVEVRLAGYKTDIPGAKVDLQALAEQNKSRGKEQSGYYQDVYFTTTSGTFYRLREIADGTWEAESSNNPKKNMIREACTIEVGQRFKSPHVINGQPELDTSPVRDITLEDPNTRAKSMGIAFSQEETDIAVRFHKAVRSRDTK